MRNLKKVLSLVLVFAMTLGLIVTAGAYTYKDQEKINKSYKDAIDLMYELKIMQGTDDNFNPETALRRSEMAKTAYVIENHGATDASNWTNYKTPFKDYKSTDWFAGYVNWAHSGGLVDGKSATKFDPNSFITGYEAVKFALTLMDYNSKTEKYTGTGWSLRVLQDASKAGLLNNLESIDMKQPIQRQHVAQLLYNALFANMVTYNATGARMNAYVDNLNMTPKTIANTYFQLDVLEGTLISNEYVGLGYNAKAGKIVVNDGGYIELNATAPLSLVGHDVKVFVKAKRNILTGAFTSIEKVYGQPVQDETETFFTCRAADLKVVAAGGNLSFEKDGRTYTTTGGAGYYVNYAATAIPATVDKSLDEQAVGRVPGGNPAFVVVNGNTIVRAVVSNYDFGTISVANEKITSRYYDDSKNAFTNIAKGDIAYGADLAVADAKVLTRKIGSYYEFVKVEEVVGINRSNVVTKTVKINDVDYELGKFTGGETSLAFAQDRGDKETTYYMFNGQVLGCKKDPDAPTTYCVITANIWAPVAGTSYMATVTILNDAGTSASYYVNSLKNSAGTDITNTLTAASVGAGGPLAVNTLLSYTLDTNKPNVVNLKQLDTAKIQTFGLKATNDAKTMSVDSVVGGGTATNKLIASSAVYFMQYANGWKVYKGQYAPAFGAVAAYQPGTYYFSNKTNVDNDTITAACVPGLAGNAPTTGSSTLKLVGILTALPSVEFESGTPKYVKYTLFDGSATTVYKATKLGGGADLTNTVDYKVGMVLTATEVTGTDLITYSAPIWEHPDIAAGKIVGGYLNSLTQNGWVSIYHCTADKVVPGSAAANTPMSYSMVTTTKVYETTNGVDWTLKTDGAGRICDIDDTKADKANTIVVIDPGTGNVSTVFIDRTGSTWSLT